MRFCQQCEMRLDESDSASFIFGLLASVGWVEFVSWLRPGGASGQGIRKSQQVKWQVIFVLISEAARRSRSLVHERTFRRELASCEGYSSTEWIEAKSEHSRLRPLTISVCSLNTQHIPLAHWQMFPLSIPRAVLMVIAFRFTSLPYISHPQTRSLRKYKTSHPRDDCYILWSTKYKKW